MTVSHTEARTIFEDARRMHAAALERLEAGDIRDAAEKAWCATKRATDALILARTGTEPRTSGQTRKGIGALEHQDSRCQPLRQLYGLLQTFLHGGCFYDGDCDGPTIGEDIRAAAQYIRHAEALAWE